jgi:high-affinity Fe2+/Pb2+ permease
MYEVNNTGGWYDFGFILGACIALGGGGGAGWKKKRRKRTKDKEWEEIGKKVEVKVRKGIKEWLDESEKKDDDWEEIGRKIEEKIKRKLRDWAED